MKKLNVGVLLIQFFGMIILINGILQLRIYTAAEKVICIKKHCNSQESKNWSALFPTKEDALSFWPSIYIWIFLGLLFGILAIGFLNWKNKLSSINTILLALALYMLMRLKFFRKEVISLFFRPIRTVLSNDFATQCLIEGVVFTVIGIFILYLSVTSNLFLLQKDTAENQ
ncbi:hypothetical protein [Flavobacterium ginsenosidimutans]|uniref:Uncharacterized protein n=1 Tax=Flavobacterium ginsenosidimutans TaxID=687844 RepID=A0ABZ2Q763_9FLAO|nr:hypothetical protein [Flavobacterium ginsenosidimutans]KAF2332875.1 hypothetical protein DM444_08665 [Flavobacterium ginsenosidimutans]